MDQCWKCAIHENGRMKTKALTPTTYTCRPDRSIVRMEIRVKGFGFPLTRRQDNVHDTPPPTWSQRPHPLELLPPSLHRHSPVKVGRVQMPRRDCQIQCAFTRSMRFLGATLLAVGHVHRLLVERRPRRASFPVPPFWRQAVNCRAAISLQEG